MRRNNRPSLPPGSLPPRSSQPPPGLPLPQQGPNTLPPQAPSQQPTITQQAAFDHHRRQTRTIAYEALVARNSAPEAATIPRPSPPGPLPLASNHSLPPPGLGLNGVASGGLSNSRSRHCTALNVVF